MSSHFLLPILLGIVREKRARSREFVTEQVAVEDQCVTENVAAEVKSLSEINSSENIIANEIIVSEEINKIETEVVNVEAKIIENVIVDKTPEAEEAGDKNYGVIEQNNEVTEALNNCGAAAKAVSPGSDSTDKDTEIVSGLGVFNNSPFDSVSQDEVDSLDRFIHSEPHILQNIESVKYDVTNIKSRAVNKNKYVHTVPVVIKVRRKNLWEPAAKYLDKFLVKFEKERKDGTIIRLDNLKQEH